MRRNAHIKKSLSESHELRTNFEKCNKMQHKKAPNKEESAILLHDNAGAGWMRREFMYTIRARQDRDDLLPGRGICAHDNARLSCCRSEFIYTDMRGGKIRHFRHPKRVSEHESARGGHPQFSQSLKRVRPAAGSASLTRCAARRRVLESWTIN